MLICLKLPNVALIFKSGILAFTVVGLPIGEDVFEYWFTSQGSTTKTRLVI